MATIVQKIQRAFGFKTIKTIKVTNKDLSLVKKLNQNNQIDSVREFSGTTYESFNKSGFMLDFTNKYSFMWINKIRNFHFSKFDWSGLPDGITKKRIEDILLGYGSVCIYKVANLYIAAPFVATEFNIAGQPIKIKAFSQFSTEQEKGQNIELSVNTDDADACIIYNDNAGWVIGDSTQYKTYGVFYKIWAVLDELILSHRRIENNGSLSNPKLANDGNDNDNKSNKKIEDAIRSSKLVVNLDLDSLGKMKALQGKAESSPVIIFPNQQADFWANHERLKSELKDNLGVKHSPFTEKKEKQSGMELGQNDSWVAADLYTECEMREKGVEIANKLFKLNMSVCIKDIHSQDKVAEKGSEEPPAPKKKKDGEE